MKGIPFVLALVLVLAGGWHRSRTVQRSETIMGTEVTITVVAKTPEAGRLAIDQGMAELRRLDSLL